MGASAHDNLGSVLLEQGDLDGAASAFQAALAVDPRLVDAHTHLGQVLRDQGNANNAAIAFREALKLDPTQAAVHCDLGMALRMQGDLNGAIDSFNTALNLDPGNPEIRSTYEDLMKEKKSQKTSVKEMPGKRNRLDYGRFDGICSD